LIFGAQRKITSLMCGIVGLFIKNPALEPALGRLFERMLVCLSNRGPDSAGFAIYRDDVRPGRLKVTLHSPEPAFAWATVAADLAGRFAQPVEHRVCSSHAVFVLDADAGAVAARLAAAFPQVNVMSLGHRIEIMKEVGSPASVLERFQVSEICGSHAIGHTRMATESAVTTRGSHPFSSGVDLCLVHNGSLSNHHRVRSRLQRQGIAFGTDNDSEVAAGYLNWRLQSGDSLKQALAQALVDLDGFYTFAVGTADGFGVLRDPIACKPAIIAETADYVAMASEYRALADLPGIEQAKLWEPEPGIVYSWSKSRR
jgi:amidophosphoribosyltransferase